MSLVRAIGGASSILLAIPLSAFSDSFDRKRAALLSLAFTVIPHFAYTFSTRWEQLIPFKMMANIDWGLYTPAEVAMIADITVSSKRGRVYGLAGVAHPIGSIATPLVGGWILDNYGWNTVLYSIVFTAIAALIPTLFITETKGDKHARAESHHHILSKIDPDFFNPMLIFAGFNFFEGIRMGLPDHIHLPEGTKLPVFSKASSSPSAQWFLSC